MMLFYLSGMPVVVQSYLLLLMKQNTLSWTLGSHFNAVFTLATVSVQPDVVPSKLGLPHLCILQEQTVLASDRPHDLLTRGST